MATAMVTRGSLLWSRYYLLTLSMSVFNLGFAAWSFWNYEAESGQPLITASNQNAPKQWTQMKENLSNMVKSFKSKTVILGALFIFAYQGAEVSISGVSTGFEFTYGLSITALPLSLAKQILTLISVVGDILPYCHSSW
jgi:hypothetical protein